MFNPIINAVTVVPTLAPMDIPIACSSDINPARTKEIEITVAAVDDCIIAVITVPTKIADIKLPVYFSI